MMKICHLTSVHKDNDVRIVLKEVYSLSKSYETILLVNNPTQSTDTQFRKVNLELKFNNRLSRIIFSKRLILKKSLEVEADIYHFHDPELLSVGNKLVKRNKKVIYDIHEDTSKQILSKHYIPRFLRKPISKIFSFYEKRSIKNYSAIVTATPFLKSKFEKYNVNTVDINNYPLLYEFVDIEPRRNTTPKVTYIGGLTEERGVFQMIRLANQFSNVNFCFCGNFSNPKDEKKAKSMQEHNNIEFRGFVSREEIKNVLENSTVGLVLLKKNERYKDSLPIKMFEYMAASLPVIATNFKLWESILNESNAGITVNPDDFDKLKEALSSILKDEKTARKMGENGREFVIKKYNWSNEEKKLNKLYKKIEEELV